MKSTISARREYAGPAAVAQAVSERVEQTVAVARLSPNRHARPAQDFVRAAHACHCTEERLLRAARVPPRVSMLLARLAEVWAERRLVLAVALVAHGRWKCRPLHVLSRERRATDGLGELRRELLPVAESRDARGLEGCQQVGRPLESSGSATNSSSEAA